jgi:hypothetical protein
MYLAMIYEAEYSPELQKNPFETLDQSGDDFLALENILIPSIESFNITIDQLKSVFDGILQPTLGFSDSCFLPFYPHGYPNSPSYCMTSKNISYIGSNEICFTFSGQQLVIDTSGDVSDPIIFLPYFDPPYVSAAVVDLTGKGIPSTDSSIALQDSNDVLFNIEKAITLSIKVIGVTQNLPKVNGVVRCSENLTPNDCLKDCISQFISRKCGCVPIILPFKGQKVAEKCTFDKYSNCLNYSNYGDNGYLICKTACLPSCQTWHYDFDFDDNWDSMHVEFHFLTFDYVIFQETKESFGDFTSALGGALGIWLGLDMVILIQFILQPVMIFVRRYLPKTDENGEEDRVVEVNQTETYHSNLEKLKKVLEKHASAHGKGAYLIGLWIFQTIFWAVIYATGGVYTAYYSFTLCQQYLSEETSSHASLMFNKTMTLPPATLCTFNLITRQLEYLALEEMEKCGRMNYSELLESQFNDTSINKTSFLSSDTPWSKTLLYIASLYVTILQLTESYGMYSDSNFTAAFSYMSEAQIFFPGTSLVTPPDNYTIQWIYDNYFSNASSSNLQFAQKSMHTLFERL